MSNDLILLILIVIVGLLNIAVMMWESSKYYGVAAKLWGEHAKQWKEHTAHWDSSTRLWKALNKKEDRHE